jgi:uncharacterized membrane protein HdeD (DUF308 family)
VVILLTGILHIFGGFRVGEGAHRTWSLTAFLVGAFEAMLGVMLVIEPYRRSIFFYLVVGIWALVGGFILISDAVRLRRTYLSEVEHEKEQVT